MADGKFYGIQHLRALAAIAVVFHHTIPQATRAYGLTYSGDYNFGAAGVDIFFVISGFIMVHITQGREHAPLGFFLRRAVRVVPLYWLFTLLAFAFINTYSFFMSGPGGIWPLVKSLLFIPTDLRGAQKYPLPLVAVGWSLVLEMAFYLLLSVALLARKSYIPTCLLLVLTLFCVAYAIPGKPVGLAYYALYNGVMLEFLLGILLAFALREAGPIRPIIGLAVAGLGCVLLVVLVGLRNFDYRLLTAGLPSMFIVGGMVVAEPLFRSSTSKALSLVGDASYSIYLCHLFVIVPTFRFVSLHPAWTAQHLPLPLIILGVAAVCILSGIAVHIVVERPLARALHERFFRAKPRPATVVLSQS